MLCQQALQPLLSRLALFRVLALLLLVPRVQRKPHVSILLRAHVALVTIVDTHINGLHQGARSVVHQLSS